MTVMIPAQSTIEDATTNASVRRADQRGSVGPGSAHGVDVGREEAVTEVSSGVCGSIERNAALRPVWGSYLFKVRQAAGARPYEVVSLPREILLPSPIGRTLSIARPPRLSGSGVG